MENVDNEFVDFVMADGDYKTKLTQKYNQRTKWSKPVEGEVLAHLPGTIIEVKVNEGDHVKAGQLLLIHQAMKMYNRIVAPIEGIVASVDVKSGDNIPKDYLMIKIKPE